MAQKSKKNTRKTSAARPSGDSLELRSSGTLTPPASSRSFSAEFNPDYSETIKDLKRIAILAGIFFAILIGLALVLP